MRTVRFCSAVLTAIALATGATPAVAAEPQATPTTRRIDLDPGGQPDPNPNAWVGVQKVSASGRYILLTVASDSTLVSPVNRTPGANHLLRKDLQSHRSLLVNTKPDGSVLQAGSVATMSPDGTKFVYSNHWTNGLAVIYLRDFTAKTVRALHTLPDKWILGWVHVSADGQWVSWTAHYGSNGTILQRHNVATGVTSTLMDCPTPATGCYLRSAPEVSDDGRKYIFQLRPADDAEDELRLLDAGTGQQTVLAEGGGYYSVKLSGDGNWVFYVLGSGCPSCGDVKTFQLKKIGTAPGAAPAVLRTWRDNVTWGVSTTSVSYDGSIVGYNRQTGEGGLWFGASPGYLYNQTTQQETRLPDTARPDKAYFGRPSLSGDGRVAVAREECFFFISCTPVGTYAIQ